MEQQYAKHRVLQGVDRAPAKEMCALQAANFVKDRNNDRDWRNNPRLLSPSP
jgi:hypothetical protein